jgi:hypothetical protein
MNEKLETPKTWYQSPVVVALVAVVAGFIAGSVSSLWNQAREMRGRSESLKVAFAGEIHEIRQCVRGPARKAAAAWQEGQPLFFPKLHCPREIYHANSGHLGDLRDAKLAFYLVSLYSKLEWAGDLGRDIAAATQNAPPTIREQVILLEGILAMATLLDMRLQEQTKNLHELDWSVTAGPQDEEDYNFAQTMLNRLGAANGLDGGASSAR